MFSNSDFAEVQAASYVTSLGLFIASGFMGSNTTAFFCKSQYYGVGVLKLLQGDHERCYFLFGLRDFGIFVTRFIMLSGL